MSRTTSILAIALPILLTSPSLGTDVPADSATTSGEEETIVDCERIRGDGGAVAAIEATFRAWAEALRSRDFQALGDLVTEDAEFWTHSRPPLVGRSALAASFESLFARGELEQEFDCRELIVAGDWAFVRGMEHNTFTPENGGEPMEIRQRAFSVLHRGGDGTWRFARGMTNLSGDSP